MSRNHDGRIHIKNCTRCNWPMKWVRKRRKYCDKCLQIVWKEQGMKWSETINHQLALKRTRETFNDKRLMEELDTYFKIQEYCNS